MLSISVCTGKEVRKYTVIPPVRPPADLSLQQQKFSIHKGLLQKITKYFDKLIASGDGQKGLIVLKDENSEICKMFYDWIYTAIPLYPKR